MSTEPGAYDTLVMVVTRGDGRWDWRWSLFSGRARPPYRLPIRTGNTLTRWGAILEAKRAAHWLRSDRGANERIERTI